MSDVKQGRWTAKIEGDFVVFMIGARLNRWWKLPKYLWFLPTMPKMLAEVAAKPESGFHAGEWFAHGPHVFCRFWFLPSPCPVSVSCPFVPFVDSESTSAFICVYLRFHLLL